MLESIVLSYRIIRLIRDLMMNVCAGLVKIIKKNDKRTGALICLPFIQDVLTQPFFKIDVLNQLVKECEMILSILFTNDLPSISEDFEEDERGSVTGTENKETLMHVPKELVEI